MQPKKKIHVRKAMPGMVLAADLLSDTGRIILSQETRLTEIMLRSLSAWNVTYIDIYHSDLLPENFQTEQLDDKYSDMMHIIENSFVTMRFCKELPLAEMREMAVDSVLHMTDTVGVLPYLQSMRRTGEYTFHHSINVSILCGVIGKWMGYKGTELEDLVLAGLLHDIGKTQVSELLINKPEKLNAEEMAEMKRHSKLGTELIQKAGTISSNVTDAVLQHHERMDGSGYPNGLAGRYIHPYARIVAIADLYDAVTSDRPFQGKASPFAAARIIASEMFGRLDMKTATTFLEHIRDHFIGTRVCLTDGRQAEVILLGNDFTFKPIIRTEAGEFLDTRCNPEIQIREVTLV